MPTLVGDNESGALGVCLRLEEGADPEVLVIATVQGVSLQVRLTPEDAEAFAKAMYADAAKGKKQPIATES